jgi:hypothetical protein
MRVRFRAVADCDVACLPLHCIADDSHGYFMSHLAAVLYIFRIYMCVRACMCMCVRVCDSVHQSMGVERYTTLGLARGWKDDEYLFCLRA